MSSATIELEAALIERTVEKRNSLLARAKERAERILQAAERECERIRAESDKQVLAMVASELRAVRDRILGRADLEGRKALMQAREETLAAVFQDAEGRLRAMAEGRGGAVNYGEILTRLILEAATAVGGGEFVVAANEADLRYLKGHIKEVKARVEEALGQAEVRLAEEPIEAMGGVTVRNGDGTKTFYNTLEARLLKAKARMEAQVAESLEVI